MLKRKIPMLLITFLLSALLLCAAVACNGGGDAKFSLDRASAQVGVGQSITLEPQFSGFGDGGPTAADVTWSSSAPAVASVSGGVVYGVSEGAAVITAAFTFEGADYSAACDVTVLPGEASGYEVEIVLDASKISLQEGDKTTLLPDVTVTLWGEEQPAPEVAWHSENEQVAVVSGGTVTAIAEGSTTIVASITVGGREYRATCAVTVSPAPKTIVQLDATDLSLYPGQSKPLTATVTDKNGEPIPDAQVEWTSSDASVADVSADGVVTGVARGYAVITAAVDGVAASCAVDVADVWNVKRFAYDGNAFGAAYELRQGQVSNAALLDELAIEIERNGAPLTDLAAYTDLTVTSSAEEVLSVTAEGLTLHQHGTATVTVTLTEAVSEGAVLAEATFPVTVCDRVIDSEEDFLAIDGSQYYVLAADLDFSAGYALGEAGSGVTLTGTLDGGGHTITAAFATGAQNNSGLFFDIEGGTIKNLSVTASYGTLQPIHFPDIDWYRFGPLAVTSSAVTVDNCFIRTTFTDTAELPVNQGISGLIGYVGGNSTINNTIVAVTAPAEATYTCGIISDYTWANYCTLNNVLVYTSGANVPAVGTNGEPKTTNFASYVGGLGKAEAEAARTELLAKAEEYELSAFVRGAFEDAELYEKGQIAFAEENPDRVKAGEEITLTVVAKNLVNGTDVPPEEIEWESSAEGLATVTGGVVRGVAEGEVTITARITVDGTTYSAEWVVYVVQDMYEVTKFEFEQARYDLEVGGGYTLDDLALDAAATQGGAPWDGWADYVTYTSDNSELLAISGNTVEVKGAGTVKLTATFSRAGVTATAETTVELWTKMIGSEAEYTQLGSNATWDGRYLLTADLDFSAGYALGADGSHVSLTGTLDGGGHTITAAFATGARNKSALFYEANGTIKNLAVVATYGTLVGMPVAGGDTWYRFGPLGVTSSGVTIDNCYVRTTFTDTAELLANHGISGLVGYVGGNSTISNTIVAVTAPAEATYTCGIISDFTWANYCTLNNVLVYTSGANVPAVGTNGEPKATNFAAATGGFDGTAAEPARAELLAKAEEYELSAFVRDAFEDAELYEKGQIAFAEENPDRVKAGEEITLTVVAKNLVNGTDVPPEEIEWESSAEGLATVTDGVVRGVAEGEVTITARITVDGKTFSASWVVNVWEDVYEVTEFEFEQARYDLEVGGSYTLDDLVLNVAATINSEEWNGWADYVTYTSDKSELLAITGSTVEVKGTGTVKLTATFSRAGVTATAETTVELWTKMIGSEAEYTQLGGNATWDGRYLLTADLNFSAGYALGEAGSGVTLTGTLDGGEHTITVTFATGAHNNSGLFFEIKGGAIKNLSVTASYGTLQPIHFPDIDWYRFGPLAVTSSAVTVDNCFVRTTFTDTAELPANHGIAGLIGNISGNSTVSNTIVAVTAPAEATYAFGLIATASWSNFYTLNNVLVYTSGSNVPAVGTNGEPKATNFASETGGFDGTAAEPARTELLAKAEEYGLSAFVCDAFEDAELYEKGQIAFAEENPDRVKAGEEITLTVVAKNLVNGTDVPPEEIEWESSAEGLATVNGGVVRGIAEGEVTITARITVDGTTYSAEWVVNVWEDVYEVTELAFGQDRYDLEIGGSYTTDEFILNATASLNGEPWDGWAEYVTYTSDNSELLAINGNTVEVKGAGTVKLTATFSRAGVTATAETTVELWTKMIGSEAEYTQLGSNATWDGRYLLTADLDFSAGYALGADGSHVSLTGTLDGGGHTITAAFATGARNKSALFYEANGTIKNLAVVATYGTLVGMPVAGGDIWYRFGPLGVTSSGVTIDNCYVRTTFTDTTEQSTNHGISGLVGYVGGNSTVSNTIVAVTAPAEATYAFGLIATASWSNFYTLNNVLVYTSGSNVPAVGTNGEPKATNFASATGGFDGTAAEPARTELLAKAEEYGLSAFVRNAFEDAELYEKGQIAFAEENPDRVKAGEEITLTVEAKNLVDGTDVPPEEIEWESSAEGLATVTGGVVRGVAEGEVTITARITVDGKTFSASWNVSVWENEYEVTSFAFTEQTYDLEVGGSYTTDEFILNATASLNGEPWDGWTEYVTYTSDNSELLAITGSTVEVKGTGTVKLTATFSRAGVTATAETTVELWTTLIDSADEFLALGAYTNGTIADWSGRYLVTQDLDFAGKTVTQLGNVSGVLDGGGHKLEHIELAATGNGLADSSTKEGDDRFLFYFVEGTITNINITVTLGTDYVQANAAGLCFRLIGTFSDSTLNVRFRSLSSGQTDIGNAIGGVCVYADWQSETIRCTVNVGWLFTDWDIPNGGDYVSVHERGFGYCYTFWGTNQAKLTDVTINSTAHIEYATNSSNVINTNCSITQNDGPFMAEDEFKALFA